MGANSRLRAKSPRVDHWVAVAIERTALDPREMPRRLALQLTRADKPRTIGVRITRPTYDQSTVVALASLLPVVHSHPITKITLNCTMATATLTRGHLMPESESAAGRVEDVM